MALDDRVETFARLLNAVGAWLTPPFVRRIDRSLLLTHPLAWRASIHIVLWWSLVACAFAAGAALALIRSAEDVWTLPELWGTRLTATYVSAVVCLAWAVLELRLPVGELAWRGQLKLWLLNAVAILLLFLPGSVFTLTATHRIANSLSGAEFDQMYEFNDKFGFWRCSERLTEDALAANQKELARTLKTLHLATPGKVERDYTCGSENLGSLVIHDAGSAPDAAPSGVGFAGQNLLEARLASIRSSQALWEYQIGDCYNGHLAAARAGLWLVAWGALLLGLFSYPKYAWQRTWLSQLRFRIRGVGWGLGDGRLARLDHRFLVRRPLLWAARAHLAPLFCAALALFFSVCLLLFELAGRGWESSLGVLLTRPSSVLDPKSDFTQVVGGCCIGAALVWPYLWLVVRRHDVGIVPSVRWGAVQDSFFVSLFFAPVLLAEIGVLIGRFDAAIIYLIVLLGGLFNALLVMGIANVRAHCGRLATLFWFLGLFVTNPIGAVLGWSGAIAMVLAAIGLFARPAPVRRVAAIVAILSLPGVLLGFGKELLPDKFSDAWPAFVPLGVLVLLSYPAYRFLVGAFAKALARTRYEPLAQ